MANINIHYNGLTGQRYNLTIDNGQTMTQLRAAIASNEQLGVANYENVSLLADISKSYVNNASDTLASIGAVTGSIFICKTLSTGTKQAKQEAKLAVATEKRHGDGVTSAAFYRTLKTADVNDLPTKYSGNNVVNNANSGGLKNGRPWS